MVECRYAADPEMLELARNLAAVFAKTGRGPQAPKITDASADFYKTLLVDREWPRLVLGGENPMWMFMPDGEVLPWLGDGAWLVALLDMLPATEERSDADFCLARFTDSDGVQSWLLNNEWGEGGGETPQVAAAHVVMGLFDDDGTPMWEPVTSIEETS